MTAHERTACEGEVCSCGRPAVRAFVVDGVVTPFCGITDDGLMLRVRSVDAQPVPALVR